MNRQIRLLGLALLGCFTLLFAQLNYIQVFRAGDLADKPGNSREEVRTFNRPRGRILSADGDVLARSVPTGGSLKFQRRYPTGELFAHITGYLNFNFGSEGLEETYDDELSGRSPELDLTELSEVLIDEENTGDVELTIRRDLQQAARDALGDRAGSVVALDPRNGSVLAMWSNPSYDPNALATNDEAAMDARALLEAAPGQPLLPRAYRGTFFPGSTFKLVTAATGVTSGRVTPQRPDYPTTEGFDIDFTDDDLSNFGGEACGGTLFEILAASCNSAFARMGAETLGPRLMVRGAESFGFNREPPLDLPAVAESTFPTDFPDNQGNGPLARASIGQGDTTATPLQMALVAAAVANDGAIMAPHVMGEITDRRGEVTRTWEPRVWTRPMRPPAARVMRTGMIGVVEEGTATNLAIPGVEVGGKTGTAQLGTDPPSSHAWIVGFAGPPGGESTVAVAVIVEAQPGVNQTTGGRVAAPIARTVIQRTLEPR